MPISATGRPSSGKSVMTASPSSSTNSARTPRERSSCAAACAPRPPASSSWPLTRWTVRCGLKPLAASASKASNSATSDPLLSIAPRPQTAPSAITPSNGGWDQSPSVPAVTGTTSWCAISTIAGNAGSDPGQV
jgi:hypothetical protein